MELSLKKKGVDCFEEIVCETIRKEETLDSVVPDTMPDICEIISTSGLVLIRSKDVADGKIRLEANVQARVIYMPEGGTGTQCISVTVPVSMSLENDEIDSYSKCCAKIKLLSIDARMLNPRKILVKAEVSATINCYRPGRVEYNYAPEEDCQDINLLEKKTDITPAVCVSEKSFVIVDEHQIPASKTAASEIVGVRVNLICEDAKTVGSKIVVKGSAKTQLLYIDTNGALCSTEFITGFSQIIESDNVSENPYINIDLMLSGVYVELLGDSAGRMVSIELHALAQYVTSERCPVVYLADAYSNTNELEVKSEQLKAQVIERELTLSETLRETIETPIQVSELVDFCASASGAIVSADKVIVPITLNIIYLGTDEQLHSFRKKLEVPMDCEEELGGEVLISTADCTNAFASAAGGAIETRIAIEAHGVLCKNKTIGYISEIDVSEDKKENAASRPSLVLKLASSDDDLWEIAKRYGSTVQSIIDANEITPDEFWEKYILIPKMS